jgi:hypothetical protein
MKNGDMFSNELEDICFGDKRIDKRSKILLESLYAGVNSGLTSSCRGKAEIKGAYRFFDNDSVDHNKIIEPHYLKTLERIKKHKIIGRCQDTTDIDMKHMETVENLGVLNDTKRPGCSLHPVIAFTPDKLCLGVVSTKFIIRPAEELGKKTHNNLRDIKDKESFRWIEGYRAACKIAEECPETKCVSIGDRESDIYELLLEATNPANKADIIIRAWHDRKVDLPRTEEHENLINENVKLQNENKNLSLANKKAIKNKKIVSLSPEEREIYEKNKISIEQNKILIKTNNSIVLADEKIKNTFLHQLNKGNIIGTVEFELHKRGDRKSRTVKQNIRAITIDLMPSVHKKNLPKLSINAVLLEEIDTPAGEEPISWMFLTTLSIDSLEDIQLIIKLYISRWGIELFFKVLKSGCKIEELQFKEASRLLSCISLYMIVAWRVLFTTFLGRECPDAPCSILFETDEWQSVYASHMKAMPPNEPPKLGEFMLMIAALGGYQARKSQGPPGMIVIWKGLQKAYGLSEGWAMHREFGRRATI